MAHSQVLHLDRAAFNRLCGSLFEVLERSMEKYQCVGPEHISYHILLVRASRRSTSARNLQPTTDFR